MAQECSVPRPSRVSVGFRSSAAIIPGIIRQMPTTLKERKRSVDRVVSLLRAAATWSALSPKVSSTLTDLSIGSSRTALPFISSRNFQIPAESVGNACVGPRLPKSTVKSALQVRIWERTRETVNGRFMLSSSRNNSICDASFVSHCWNIISLHRICV